MANWYDDFLDGASDLASKASFDNVFGETPESGSLMDIGQSLLNPNYDPESNLIARVLRENPNQGVGGAGVSSDGVTPMYGSSAPETNPVDRTNEPDPEPFVPSEYVMNMPAKMSMDIAGVPRKREVGMVGGKPRMQLNANTEEEEEMARLAQYLRNRG
jgi:hypothetical protein